MLQDSKPKTFKTPRSADKWLKTTDKLKKIQQKQQIEQSLKSILCAQTGLQDESFYVVSSDGSTLLLQTNNAVVATQFRIASKQLLAKIDDHRDWKGKFENLKVVVRPMYHKERSKQQALRGISSESAQLLEEVADHTENPKLQAILRRIAKHRDSQEES